MLYGYYLDPTYILVIIAFLLTMFASFGVKSTFNKYNDVHSSRGITAADAARKILDANGLYNIRIERVSGELTDHFSPKESVIRLSDSTYNSTSVAAIGVAAHECGHAVQHQVGYVPIRVRNSIVPVVNICNALAMPLFLIGLILGIGNLAMAGAILFGAVLVFQLVTLPTQINASRRAIKTLESMYLLEDKELVGARKTLTAAAMTYVAAVAASALQLLRLLMLANRRRD
ncbi:MAG: zinc metallopeptidase [Oscillospiraceae bacterium]|nr:zinc metallopeptidase [Oscillospiraceae bacterium]